MKKGLLNILPAILIGTLILAAMAFQDSTKNKTKIQKVTIDTIPKISDGDIINMDEIEKSINKSMEAVDKSLKAINWDQISTEIEQSLKKIDMDKIRLEIDRSMNSVDWDKMKNEINRSMKEFDKEKIQKEIDRSMKEFDKEKIQKEIELAMNDVKKNMNELKNFNSEEFKKEMEKAKEEIKKAKIEVGQLKEMLIEMDKDGLINKKDGYDIEYKNKELFINGKKQSQEVTEKYRKYFKGENFKMKRDSTD